MTTGPLQFARSRATEEQVLAHLIRCDDRYNPPLSQRVDLVQYARKLRERAETLEAWAGPDLVGLVAIYINDSSAVAFVSSVSVDGALTGQGIGSRLLADAIGLARARGMAAVSLEVSTKSRAALRVYEKHGFRIAREGTDILEMNLPLTEQAP